MSEFFRTVCTVLMADLRGECDRDEGGYVPQNVA